MSAVRDDPGGPTTDDPGLAPEDAVTSSKPTPAAAEIRPEECPRGLRERSMQAPAFSVTKFDSWVVRPGLYTVQPDTFFVFTEDLRVNTNRFLPRTEIKRV